VNSIVASLLIWCLAIFIQCWWVRKRDFQSIGLPLSYLVSMALIHVTGAMLYIDNAYSLYEITWVEDGFYLSALGALGVSIGATISQWRTHKPSSFIAYTKDSAQPIMRMLRPFPLLLFGIGYWLFLLPIISRIPSGAALSSGFVSLIPAAAFLGIFKARLEKNLTYMLGWLIMLLLVPVFTVASSGFLGFGITMMIIVICALLLVFKPWRRWLLLSPVVLFFGLSVYLSYMISRDDIREKVWSNPTLSDRISAITETYEKAEWFDPSDMSQRKIIDGRLNQNVFVGQVRQRVETGVVQIVDGETIVAGLAAFVPRIFWPDKPAVAGSGILVSRFTGTKFAEGTSVGIGQVLEFYINFGVTGMAICFFILGALLGWLDTRAANALRNLQWRQFIIFLLAGIGLIQPIGSFTEILTSPISGVIAAIVVGRLILGRRWISLNSKQK
jgi:hypothetical protein